MGGGILLLLGTAGAGGPLEKRAAEFREGVQKTADLYPGKEPATANEEHGKIVPPAGKGPRKPAVKTEAAVGHGKEAAGTSHGTDTPEITASEAMKQLMEGNRRYVFGKSRGPNRSQKHRAALAGGQHPFAIIVGCSDSRVPPELVFDTGLGDLFVVRTAGNIVDDIAIGSIEYAVEHLGTPLIIVLGHERCGAVTAAVQGDDAPGHLKAVVDAIASAVEKAKQKHGDLLANSVRENAKMVAKKLKASGPILSEYVEDGRLKVIGAYYDLDTGAVTITYDPCGPG